MKVFITGGTGFVGSYLISRLADLGHEVTTVTRGTAGRTPRSGVSFIQGSTTAPGAWQQGVTGHDTVINLAGASIFTRWTKDARRSIIESRVLTTRNLVDAMAACDPKPLLLSTSAVGYYGSREDDAIIDETSPPGDEFLTRVSVEWEAEARRAEAFGSRVALCRFGIILGRGGGALAKMAPAFKYMVGSVLGSGRQWFPWIHLEDVFQIVLFLMERRHISGPVNFTAPNPVTNEELSRELARAFGKPLFMPAVPAFALRIMLGEFGDVLLKGQRAIPRRLLDEGYRFRFPELRGALADLLRDSR